MRGSVERRGTAWRVRVDAGRDPISGRRRQLTRTVRGTKREANDVLARMLVDLGQGRHGSTSAVTVGGLCEAWLEHASASLASNTALAFEGVVRRYLGPRSDVPERYDVLRTGLSGTPIGKLRAWHLDRLYDQLLVAGGTAGRPLAPGTVRKVHTVLRLALEQAVRWQWLAENPALHASPPRVPRRNPTPPGSDTAAALVEGADSMDPDWGAYLRLAAALGARRAEVCALRWSAVDLDAGTAAIVRTLVLSKDGVVLREYPKTASSRRRVALDAGTKAVLEAHRSRQAERARMFGTAPAPDAFLFSVELDGSRPWKPQVVTHKFERLCRQLGVDGVRLHDLRHYVATQLIAAGVDVRTVAGRLGHANPNVTLGTYAAWVPARDQEAAELMGSLLDGARGKKGSS